MTSAAIASSVRAIASGRPRSVMTAPNQQIDRECHHTADQRVCAPGEQQFIDVVHRMPTRRHSQRQRRDENDCDRVVQDNRPTRR